MNKWSNKIKNTLSSDCFSASCLTATPENQARERYKQPNKIDYGTDREYSDTDKKNL
jgi:hypothetical protein